MDWCKCFTPERSGEYSPNMDAEKCLVCKNWISSQRIMEESIPKLQREVPGENNLCL